MAKPPRPQAPNAVHGEAAYPVGYGKPPKASQFQKGQSGNPGGASKKVRARTAEATGSPFDHVLLAAAGRKIAINENGVRSAITTHEAIVRQLTIGAAKGERSAQKHYFDQVQSARERQHNEKMARFGLLAQYVNEHAGRRGDMAAAGTEPLLPHPDDVVLNYVACVGEVVGPIDAHQALPLLALIDDYHVWRARSAALENLAMPTDGELEAMRGMAIGTIAGLLRTIRHRLPPSLTARLDRDEGTIAAGALEIVDPGGSTITISMLSPEDCNSLHVLTALNALAASLVREICRRPRLDITANTISLVNRLQVERQNREGGAPPAPAVPEFSQFYDGFASEVDGMIDETSR